MLKLGVGTRSTAAERKENCFEGSYYGKRSPRFEEMLRLIVQGEAICRRKWANESRRLLETDVQVGRPTMSDLSIFSTSAW